MANDDRPVPSGVSPRNTRFRVQLRLRTFLVLVGLIGLSLSPLGMLRRYESQRRVIGEMNVHRDWYRTEAEGPARLLGLRAGYFESLTHLEYRTRPGGPTLPDFNGLTKLRGLSLPHSPITDEDLAKLQGLKNLEVLYLCVDQLTDDGLRQLHHLKQLKELQLGQLAVGEPDRTYHGPCRITDGGLQELRRALPKLKIVDNVCPPGWSVPGMYFPEEEQ